MKRCPDAHGCDEPPDLDPGEMVYVNDIEGLDTFEPPAEFADAAWVLATARLMAGP